MEERCELTDLYKSACAHCRKQEEPEPTDISDSDEWLDWLDGEQ